MSRNSYFCAIRGPVLLITLGVLMWMDHFGNWSFGRTWPVLLVVLGLMILLDRAFGGPADTTQGGAS